MGKVMLCSSEDEEDNEDDEGPAPLGAAASRLLGPGIFFTLFMCFLAERRLLVGRRPVSP